MRKEPVEFWGVGIILCVVVLWHVGPRAFTDLRLQVNGEHGWARVVGQEAMKSSSPVQRKPRGVRFVKTTYDLYDEGKRLIRQVSLVQPGSGGVSRGQAMPILYDRNKPERFVEIPSEQKWGERVIWDFVLSILPALYLLYRLSVSPLFRKRANQIEIFEGTSRSCCKK